MGESFGEDGTTDKVMNFVQDALPPITFKYTSILLVRKVASGLSIIVEMTAKTDDGSERVFTVVGPRGRVTKIFAFMGHAL